MIPNYTESEFKAAVSTDLLPLICEQCGKVYYRQKKEILYELIHNRGRCRFCSAKCLTLANQSEKHNEKCLTCGKDVIVKRSVYEKSRSKHFFCSRSCAVAYNNSVRVRTDEYRKRVSESVKSTLLNKVELIQESHCGEKLSQTHRAHYRIRQCRVCGKEYIKTLTPGSTRVVCSKECSSYLREHRNEFLSESSRERMRHGGTESIQVQGNKRRSKNEILFCKLCEGRFVGVKHNVPIFNGWDADVILTNEKIAVLWNGKWHHEKLASGHSVEQTQNRDRIKLKEITESGYTAYVVDDFGKYNAKFVQQEFDKFCDFVENRG